METFIKIGGQVCQKKIFKNTESSTKPGMLFHVLCACSMSWGLIGAGGEFSLQAFRLNYSSEQLKLLKEFVQINLCTHLIFNHRLRRWPWRWPWDNRHPTLRLIDAFWTECHQLQKDCVKSSQMTLRHKFTLMKLHRVAEDTGYASWTVIFVPQAEEGSLFQFIARWLISRYLGISLVLDRLRFTSFNHYYYY